MHITKEKFFIALDICIYLFIHWWTETKDKIIYNKG